LIHSCLRVGPKLLCRLATSGYLLFERYVLNLALNNGQKTAIHPMAVGSG
jgi:hypothetical protein